MPTTTVHDASALLEISRDFENHRVRRENTWYGYVNDDDTWGAMPFVSTLFRGQNKRYLPMLPAISRDFESSIGELWERPSADLARFILRISQSWWFSRELDNHPISAHAAEQRVKLNRIALAQHYGIPTGYLDLTDDFNVGAFFATCCETSEGWKPVEEGVGVIYRVDLKDFNNPLGFKYKPLGPQPLPRPTEQCAWVTELPITHSFDDWPDVRLMHFHHNKNVGEYFLSKFEGGNLLFPKDPLSDVANEILVCGEIPEILVDAALKMFADDPYGIRLNQIPEIKRELSKITTAIHYRKVLTKEQISSLSEDFEWRKKMLPEIKANWRAVQDVPELSIYTDVGKQEGGEEETG